MKDNCFVISSGKTGKWENMPDFPLSQLSTLVGKVKIPSIFISNPQQSSWKNINKNSFKEKPDKILHQKLEIPARLKIFFQHAYKKAFNNEAHDDQISSSWKSFIMKREK